ncbi:putative monovalent cation/H+ antiporter subunit A [soil metagenome]
MTLLPLAVASGFALGMAAPYLWRLHGRLAVAAFVALPVALTAFLLSLAPEILAGRPARFSLAWIPGLGLDLDLSVDGLGLLFGLLICGIGAIVILYADRYLAGDPELGRFHGMLLAFMASMLGLVLADNLLLLVVFWGLTGLTSFLLIGFLHAEGTSRRAATQALVVTVAGELAMLAGLVLLGQLAGSYSLASLSAQGDLVRADPVYPLVLLLVLAGAFTKSAQVPFHFWLPNAMAAPTPVSAYLHSATMVTAGVYLLARLAPTLAGTELWSVLLVGVGGLTMLVGAGLSLRQKDLKRILAYSTVGALGLMVMLLGIDMPGAAVAAMAVLLAHALYKGALFLVTGAVDHETGTRDIERLHGLGRVMPFTALAAGLAALSMAGLPPLLGFAAKELGLKAAIADPGLGIFLVVVSVVGGAVFVAVAGIVAVGPFLGARRPDDASFHEADWRLWLSPLVLGLTGIAAGLLPWVGAGDLLGAAAGAIVGEAVTADVAPWYGVDAALLLSGVSLLAGAFLFFRRAQVRAVATRLDLGHRVGSEKAYVVIERGLEATAARVTGTLQNGRLRIYLLVVVTTLLVLEWPILIARGGLPRLELSGDVFIWELGVAGAIVSGAIMVVRSESRLSAVTALGIVGYGIAITYLLFGAPDLAMAQILVETLTLLVFVLVFYHLPRMSAVSARASRLRDAAIALASGALLTVFILAVSSGPSDPISSFFEVASQPLAHGRNVVNVILVDFRGLDTLGEVTVLAVAAFGVFSLLKLRARDRDRA